MKPKKTNKKIPETKTVSAPPANIRPYSTKQIIYCVTALVVLTFLVFSPSLDNNFIFWDDPEYVTNNPFIKNIDWNEYFTTYYMGNYHPLTMLTYAWEYKLFGFNPKAYHFNNIVFHLLNTLLVFYFTWHLAGKKLLSIAFITALLFGIHPMHVESVTWVSERKDVLYSFFFLFALITYLIYSETKKAVWMIAAFLLFILSLFSKAQAVTLPVVFLLIDFFLGKKLNLKLILEKIPFFIFSAVFGIVAIKAQQAEAAINKDFASSFDSLFWGSYGLVTYLYKAVIPVNLSAIHPYPFDEGRALPMIAYFAPLVLILFALAIYKSFKTTKWVAFGLKFFLVTILPVLKFLPVGDAIVAERYTYIPYIGLFFIAGYGYNYFVTEVRFKNYKILTNSIVIVAVLVFCVITFERTKIWKNSLTFWGDVVQKYPSYWRGHHCIAQEYYQKGNYELAIQNYSKSISADEYCPPVPYLWRGVTYLEKLNQPELAIADFKKVLDFPNKADITQKEALHNLGLAYYRKGKPDSALVLFNQVIASTPTPQAYFLRGLVYASLKNAEAAIADYTTAITLKPDYKEAYLNRGVVYTDLTGKYNDALKDFNKTLELNPKELDAKINIGVTYYKMNQQDKAIHYYTEALKEAPSNGRIYYLRALAYAVIKDYENAVSDAAKAETSGFLMDKALVYSWRK